MSRMRAMTRFQADLLLLLAAMIWGLAFIAQKTLVGIGHFEFVAVRFALSCLLVAPFAIRERARAAKSEKEVGFWLTFFLCASLTGGVLFQQVGIGLTQVTNAGFLTGLYVVFTAIMGYIILRRAPGPMVWPACGIALTGFWFINGGSITSVNTGDFLVVIASIIFSVQMVLTALIMERTRKPFTYCAYQYAFCAAVAFVLACVFEQLTWQGIVDNWVQIAYAGILSSGIGYTIQAISQQHTPHSEAAIIMSSESLFAALAGVIIMGDTLPSSGWMGCGLIMAAILLVEAAPLLKKKHANP
jgi:drug/metabolite transporter (DMT)-like permease